MGLHSQDGRQSATDVRKCQRSLCTELHQSQRSHEEGLAVGQDRRGFPGAGVALLGANADW